MRQETVLPTYFTYNICFQNIGTIDILNIEFGI